MECNIGCWQKYVASRGFPATARLSRLRCLQAKC